MAKSSKAPDGIRDIARDESSDRPQPAAWFVLLLALATCAAVVLMVLAPFFSGILLAIVAAGLIRPSYRRLSAFLSGHRHTAAAIICVVLLVGLMVPLYLIAHEVSQEALGIYEMSTTQLTEGSLRDMLERRQDQIDRLNLLMEPLGVSLTVDRVSDLLATFGIRVGGFFYKQGVSLAKHLVRFVFGFIFWLVILYYFLVDGGTFTRWFEKTIPLPVEEQRFVSHRFMDMASSLVIGNGVAAVIQGGIGGVLFAILGIQGAVLWGVVMAILAFIPVVGISLVYIPFTTILLIADKPTKAMALFVVLAVVSTVVEYWLKPQLVGRRAQMHTLLVFLSLIGGAIAFGAVGLLLGPLMMTAFLTLVEIYRERYQPYLRPVVETTPEAPDDGGSDPF